MNTLVFIIYSYGPASRLCLIPLRKNTQIVELDNTSRKDGNGFRVDLTAAAYAIHTDVAHHVAKEALAKLERKMCSEASQKIAENMIRRAPIKFIHDFKLDQHAFLNKPTTATGMAQARSAMQFVTTRRAQILVLGEAEAEMPVELLQVVPIFFENELYDKCPKKAIENYSRFAHERMKRCLDEFHMKKKDTHYLKIIRDLRELVATSS